MAVKNSQIAKLPLRDLVTQMENKCRELIEHLQMDLNPNVQEFHRLTRPKRKRSAFPSIRTVCNVSEKVRASEIYANELCEQLNEYISAIENRAQDLI